VDNNSNIDKRHWRAGQARSRFKPARVDVKDVDFSDRLNLNRRSYKTHESRRRPGAYDDEPEEYGGLSDEDDETIDVKLARLRREVEQLKSTVDEKKSSTAKDADAEEEDIFDEIEKISDALDAVYTDRNGGRGAEAELSRTITTFNRSTASKTSSQTKTKEQSRSTRTLDPEITQILSKAADFDRRLSFLEKSLGVSETNISDASSDTNKPLLPSLASLERSVQLATLQPGALEAAQSKAKQLLKDADRLQHIRPDEHSDVNGDDEKSSQLTPEQASKINALYGLLPTIDTISPTLPLVLDRLRTLQLLHSNAADTSATLDEIEKRQDDQDEEIKSWKQALETIEENLEDHEDTLAENMEKMGSWIKELEARAGKAI
jgi:nuclear migration protein JNM1